MDPVAFQLESGSHTTQTEALETVQTEEPGIRKVIYNGQVYILQEGKTYLLTGQGIE